MVVTHMEQGYSFESFGARIGVNRDTLYEWAKRHQEFSDAQKLGYDKNLDFWETQGIQALWGNKDITFNSAVWIFNMKNRHKWRDRQPEEVAQISMSSIDVEARLSKMSDDELFDIIMNKKAVLEGNNEHSVQALGPVDGKKSIIDTNFIDNRAIERVEASATRDD